MVYGRRRLRTPVFLKQSRIDGVDVNHSRRNACQRTACAVYLSQKKKGKRDTLRTENIDANQLKKKCYYRRGLGEGVWCAFGCNESERGIVWTTFLFSFCFSYPKKHTNDDVIKAATNCHARTVFDTRRCAALTRVNINIYLLLLSNKTCYVRRKPAREKYC